MKTLLKYLLFLFLNAPFLIMAQGTIAGNVKHAINANAEGKNDAGSKVFVLKYETDAVVIYETINNFLTAKKLRSLNSNVQRLITIYKDSAAVVKNQRKYDERYNYFQAAILKVKADETERVASLQLLSAETNFKFDKLDEQTAKALSQAKLKALDNRGITDESGNFSMTLAAGQHILLIISNNKVGLSSTELGGKVFVQLVNVVEGETIQIFQKFIPD